MERMREQEHSQMLYLQIAESIATPIRAGTLARGERIPSVRELARRHSVSLGTVLQAYRMLEDSRLTEARPRSGYFVAARPARLPEPETSNPPSSSMAVDVSSLAARDIVVTNSCLESITLCLRSVTQPAAPQLVMATDIR